jgi:hypothetical protein
MKPSEELFILIKALTKSEKRFFKLSSSIQTGEKNYLKLFEYIEKQEMYDENALKEHFKEETFIKHLPSEKNHLYKLILKSLRGFHSDQSPSSKLQEEIRNIEILYEKALYKECNKLIKRGKVFAYKNEKFYYLIDLLAWEKQLSEEAYESGNFSIDIDKIIKEEGEVLAKLKNLAAYHILYSKINAVFRSEGYTKNSEQRAVVNEIANEHLIKGKHTAQSYRAASICYYIKGLCAAAQRQFEDSYVNFIKTKKILDDHPVLKADLPKRYLLTHFHLFRCYLIGGEYQKAEDVLSYITSLPAEKGFRSENIMRKVEGIVFNQRMILNNMQGKFAESIAFYDEMCDLKGQDFLNAFSVEQQMLADYYLAYSYFGVNRYKNALFHLNNLLNSDYQKLRQDLFKFARLFNIILHIELGNFDLLDYIVKSIKRYLNKERSDTEIIYVVFDYLCKIIRSGSIGKSMPVLLEFKKALIQLSKDSGNDVMFEYFNIAGWVDAKIEEVSLSEAIRKNGGI